MPVYLGANFLNFLKHPQPLKFRCFGKKLCKKEGKSPLQKMGKYEPPRKSSFFKDGIVKFFFIFLWIKMKMRPYFAMQKVQKQHKTP